MRSGKTKWILRRLSVRVSGLILAVGCAYNILLDAPTRLKKEVDAVLSLQTEIGSLEKTIEDTRGCLYLLGAPPKEVKACLGALTESHAGLLAQVEHLYSSLNIEEKFPELSGVDVEFVRTLLLARDMKINIRKRSIGSFMEWEKLDQAAGGKHQALGALYSLLIHGSE